jgi:hypothetical protein
MTDENDVALFTAVLGMLGDHSGRSWWSYSRAATQVAKDDDRWNHRAVAILPGVLQHRGLPNVGDVDHFGGKTRTPLTAHYRHQRAERDVFRC